MLGKLTVFFSGLLGGVVGAIAGIWLFEWAIGQGYYALVVPGAMVGLGCGLAATDDSNLRGVFNAALAFGTGILAEWRSRPFKADDSLAYFVTHLGQLQQLTWVMLIVGTVVGFWWGRERIRPRQRKPSSTTDASLSDPTV
jgi:uncharacterized membrane protein YsdA (DUF1294 family)